MDRRARATSAVPSVKRLPFVFGPLSPPTSPKRPRALSVPVQPPAPKLRKFKNVSSLASSLHSSPEPAPIKQIKSPTNFTPGGSSKSFLALLQVVSQTVLHQRICSSFSGSSPRVQQESFTPLRADFPEIPEFTMSDSIAPSEVMKKQVSDAFAQAMSSILPSVQPQQPVSRNSEISSFPWIVLLQVSSHSHFCISSHFPSELFHNVSSHLCVQEGLCKRCRFCCAAKLCRGQAGGQDFRGCSPGCCNRVQARDRLRV